MRRVMNMMAVAAVFATAATTVAVTVTTEEPAIAQDTPLLSVDFEQDGVGADPTGWVDTSANNSMEVNDDLFKVLDADGTNALGTTSNNSNIHSHYVTAESANAANYTYTGRMQVDDQRGGVGVTFLSDYPNSDAYYRLRRYRANGAFHLTAHGTSISSGDTGTGVIPTAGTWYRFHIQVTDTGTATEIQANVWQDGTTEPTSWQIDATDANSTRRTTGTVGVWSYTSGTKYWDDLSVAPLKIDEPAQTYSVSTATTGSGEVTVAPQQDAYEQGTEITLTATPAPGWEFAGWSEDASGTQNPLDVTVDSDLNISATFTEPATPPTTEPPTTAPPSTQPPTTEPPTTAPPSTEPPTTEPPTTPPPTTSPPTSEPPTSEPPMGLLSMSFEDDVVGADPTGWVDTGAGNSMDVNDDLFKVLDADGTNALGTTSNNSNIHSHYVTAESANAANYTYTGRMRVENQRGGVGVTFLSDYPNSDAYYRLRRYKANGAFHLTAHGTSITSGDTGTGVIPTAGTWYQFHIQVTDTGTATEIQANVWQDGTTEPTSWQIDATDTSNTRRTTGTVGVWSYTSGTKYWDDLHVAVPDMGPHELTLTSDGAGEIVADPDQDAYEHGAEVTLTATPDDGFVFAGWAGDTSGSDNPTTVTMTEPHQIEAIFQEIAPVNVTANASENGTVTIEPDQPEYQIGDEITITATPDDGYLFDGWSGTINNNTNPLTLQLDSDITIAANFSPIPSYTVTATAQGSGSVTIEPDKTTYGPGEQVTLTAEPDPGWMVDHWTVDPPATRSWWDPAWSYRVPFTVAAAGTARTDVVAEVDVDLSGALDAAGIDTSVDPESLRVVEIGPAGAVTDPAVPFQFDPVTDFDPASNAAGTVTLELTGDTGPAAERRYDLYFDRPAADHEAIEFSDRVVVTEGIADAGEDTVRIATDSTTYFYDIDGGGFTSIVDRDGLDWIDYGPAAGSAGQYRGIPNMVYPEGLMHPGAEGVTSTVVHDGPLKTTIRSTAAGGAWETEWDIYPDHARMTVLAADSNYWFLYEGTPGGELNPASDIVVRSDGNTANAGTSWTQDLPGEEWVYFGDPDDDRSLYVANHQQDSAVDSYRPMEGNMTVFGFGRSGVGRYLNAVPAEFSIGLAEGVDVPGVSARITQSARPLEVSTGHAESSDGTGTVTGDGFTGDTITFGVSADHTVTAVFVEVQTTSTMSVTTSGQGSVTIDPDLPEYDHGQEVMLTAVPEPGAEFTGWSGDASGSTNPLTVVVTGHISIDAEFQAVADGPPTIDVWYGDEQEYGQIGVPQPYYNVHGNVSDPDGVASLSYTLNGGVPIPLSIGPDERRLAQPGDFNVDLPEQSLSPGANQVVLAAVDGLGNSRTKTVTINYADNMWPGEYGIDWSEAGSIDEVAQVVDGKWEITDEGLRMVEPDYDRLVAIGDTGWTDYEIEVPITLHSIDQEGFSSPQSGGAGLGFLMRWHGHTDVPVAGAQPKEGWLPHGAMGWYRWTKPDQHRLRLDGNWGSLLDYSTATPVIPGNTYMYKMRVETVEGVGGRYSLKVWEAGTPEPAQWTLTGQETLDDPQSGSVLLLAHHVDATFGDVEITPLADSSSFELDVTTSGSGSVSVDPDQATYAYGDEVSLTATPDEGFVFTGWTGDVSGSTNPITVTMNGSQQVTANFASADAPPEVSDLSVEAYPSSAVISWTTNVPATSEVAFGETTNYELGTMSDETLRMQHSVTLTGLSPETTYHYQVTSVSEGGGSASSPDLTFSTTAIDANAFVSDDFNTCTLDDDVWSFIDPKGDATMSVNGTQLELAVPGGTTHDVWTGGNMAPRVMQPVADSDLEIEVGFESIVSQSYQMQGLIIEDDADNYIRAEVHGRNGQAYIFVARFVDGQPTTIGQIPLGTLSSDDPQVGLRVTRDGDTWTIASSVEGGPWNDAVSFVHALTVTQAGVFAGNAGAAPAHTATVDYVFNTAAPIQPEDSETPSCP